MNEILKKDLKSQIRLGCVDPFVIRNLINNYGVSLMYRTANRRSRPAGYYHAQVGPEEPENDSLSTHDRFDIALLLCIMKHEGEVEFAEEIESNNGWITFDETNDPHLIKGDEA